MSAADGFDCAASMVYGWACLACGAAYFGTPPEEGLCDWCAMGAVWSGACAPGGYVCGHPEPGMPDGICGYPVESEPCPEHGPGESE